MGTNLSTKKILFELSLNSRASTKYLGRQIRASQQNASYFVNKLEKDNVILNFTLLTDSSKFGYGGFCVFLRLKMSSKSDLNEFVKYLKNYKEIVAIEFLFGSSDLFLRFLSPNPSNFNKQFNTILQEFSKKILDYFILTQIVSYEFSKDYLSRKKAKQLIIISGDREPLRITDTDKEILSYLRENSRENYSFIANKLNITSKTVISRIKSMENRGIIRGYTCLFDHSKVGVLRYYLFIRFDFNQIEDDKKFVNFVSKTDQVVEYVKVFGKWDGIIFIETFSVDKFKEILVAIKEKFADVISDFAFLEAEKTEMWNYIPEQ